MPSGVVAHVMHHVVLQVRPPARIDHNRDVWLERLGGGGQRKGREELDILVAQERLAEEAAVALVPSVRRVLFASFQSDSEGLHLAAARIIPKVVGPNGEAAVRLADACILDHAHRAARVALRVSCE